VCAPNVPPLILDVPLKDISALNVGLPDIAGLEKEHVPLKVPAEMVNLPFRVPLYVADAAKVTVPLVLIMFWLYVPEPSFQVPYIKLNCPVKNDAEIPDKSTSDP
jgi:hypothetical protein